MQVDLVRVQTADGIRLDGALQQAASDKQPKLDAVICFSGVGSNFYGSSLIEYLATTLQQKGITALRVNTRGHDGICTVSTPGGGRLQGAAYEVVDECRHDVTAWVDFLVQRGFQRIGLLGHSLGAIKILYTQSRQPNPNVCQIVAISPPRLSHQQFVKSHQSESFRESMNTARQLVQAGQADELFKATFPFPLVISAKTYVDKYGEDEQYNFIRFCDRIDCRLLFVYGQAELESGNPAFQGLTGAVNSVSSPSAEPSVVVIAGADHLYSGLHEELAHVVLGEIRR